MGNIRSLGDNAKLTSEVAAFRVNVEAKELGANNKVRQAESSLKRPTTEMIKQADTRRADLRPHINLALGTSVDLSSVFVMVNESKGG